MQYTVKVAFSSPNPERRDIRGIRSCITNIYFIFRLIQAAYWSVTCEKASECV
jgi:hypothetical protein